MAEDEEESILAIAKIALERTKEKVLEWRTTDDEESFIYSGESTSLVVARVRGPQPYEFRILNQRGTEIGSVAPKENDVWMPDADRSPDFAIIEELYTLARRSALRVDETLKAALRELKEMPPF